jgi:aryl-alcohol dehydrogenase-like predicted oxidoreductase
MTNLRQSPTMPLFSPRRSLGSTGFKATRLGIGDLADRSVPLSTCVATVHRALDAGLNVIDTAPAYENGYSEQIVGTALRGRRDGVFVIDKIDEARQPAAPQIDASLAATGLDMIDLFVFHGVSDTTLWNQLLLENGGMDQLEDAIRAGKARFAGVSSHHPDVVRAAILSKRCHVIMFPIGPYVDRRYTDELLPLAKANGLGSVCFKTFGAGKLLGDTTGYGRPLQERPRGKFSSGGSPPSNDSTPYELPRLDAAECVRFTLTCDPDVALLGLSFPNEQDAAFAAAQGFQPLTPAEMEETRTRAAAAIVGKGPCWWNPQ